MSKRYIWPTDWTLSDATSQGQSEPGSNDNKWVLCNLQRIIGGSLSDCLVLYSGHSFGVILPICRDAVGVFHSPSRVGHRTLVEEVLLLCKDTVGVFYSPSRLGHRALVEGVFPLCRDRLGV